jgi:hypothetical protein
MRDDVDALMDILLLTFMQMVSLALAINCKL